MQTWYGSGFYQTTGKRFAGLVEEFNVFSADGYDACINQARWQNLVSRAILAGWNIEQAKCIAGRCVYRYSNT